MAATHRIVELSKLIAKETTVVNGFLMNNELPTPSLDESAYLSVPIPDADGIFDHYPWEQKASMVDIGGSPGSHGSVAIGIAERFPHIHCFVQDLAETVAEGAARLSNELKDRVTFMVVSSDFFTSQSVTADVYFFRSIFHNWADKYCVKILQNLIPMLRPGARIIIHERILPDFESLETAEARRFINNDIGMLQLLNAQQRECYEWPKLFHKADARFKYIGARKPDGAIRWIIEAEWQELFS
ncbi:S-adenosyl-L-methionine-dependent methyltransferase [Rostrohypoxylon terebratum]|nr:S-adenosyl-L-methionine-dependent methyltransferase [Rostrohypoxylon terebratum]